MTSRTVDRSPASPRAGDPADVAIPRLIHQEGPRLRAAALRMCGNAADADDLLQETFLQAWRKWDTFQGRSSPRTWLYSIAARRCRRMHRRRAGQPQRIGSLEQLMPVAQPTLPDADRLNSDGLSQQVRDEARQQLESAIAALPEMFRLPIVLKDIAGFSVQEVASMLNIKPGTVKTRLHRARLRLRGALDAVLPMRNVSDEPSPYTRQMCMDLLKAKQAALDAGMPFRQQVLCERCRAVFASLDVTRDLCAELAGRSADPGLLDSLVDAIRTQSNT